MCLTILIPIIYLIACFFSGILNVEITWLIGSFIIGFFLDLIWIGILAIAD